MRFATGKSRAIFTSGSAGSKIRSAADLPHIWERFYQADAARTVSGSSGLGLSMVAWIVRAHQGEIRAESVLGEGSVFSFTFPAAGAAEK